MDDLGRTYISVSAVEGHHDPGKNTQPEKTSVCPRAPDNSLDVIQYHESGQSIPYIIMLQSTRWETNRARSCSLPVYGND